MDSLLHCEMIFKIHDLVEMNQRLAVQGRALIHLTRQTFLSGVLTKLLLGRVQGSIRRTRLLVITVG